MEDTGSLELELDGGYLVNNTELDTLPCPRTSCAVFSSTGALVRFWNFPRHTNTGLDYQCEAIPRTFEHLTTWVAER